MWTIFHTEASLGWGGQEIRILRESLGMKARGHRVVVIAQDDSTLLARASEAGLETREVSFRKKDYPRSFARLLGLIRELRPEFINTHSSRDSWLATLAAKASRHRSFVIRTRHISTPVSTSYTSALIYRRLPDKLVTTAEAIRANLITINGVDPAKVVSIPTGIDTAAYSPGGGYSDIRDELGLDPGTPLAGMVSVLRSWKGHDYFLDAAGIVAGKIPEARFIIAGDGPRKESIAEIIRGSGLEGRVLMIGHRDDVPDILSSLDVFVQPSYANEGIPQSIIQALAMEKAVVASSLEPFREIITDGETGLLVPPKDPAALAGAIVRLLRDRPTAERLGAKGRKEVVERFSIEGMLDRTEELYRELGLGCVAGNYARDKDGAASG